MWNRKQKHDTPISEQQLQAVYQLGYVAALKKAQPIQVLTPTCPLHVGVPLWTEVEPKPDGSWMYCIFCRQNQLARQTEQMKPVKNVPGLHRNRLGFMHDNWLNSADTSSQITALTPVVKLTE